MSTPTPATPAEMKKAMRANTRKIMTLREQLSALQKAQEIDSRKLDELQVKLEQVIRILSESIPTALKDLPTT